MSALTEPASSSATFGQANHSNAPPKSVLTMPVSYFPSAIPLMPRRLAQSGHSITLA